MPRSPERAGQAGRPKRDQQQIAGHHRRSTSADAQHRPSSACPKFLRATAGEASPNGSATSVATKDDRSTARPRPLVGGEAKTFSHVPRGRSAHRKVLHADPGTRLLPENGKKSGGPDQRTPLRAAPHPDTRARSIAKHRPGLYQVCESIASKNTSAADTELEKLRRIGFAPTVSAPDTRSRCVSRKLAEDLDPARSWRRP